MELTGIIEEIIYQNEVNSYTIAVLTTEDDMHTIVGYLPFVNIGDTLKVIGKFVTHKEYGEQFKIDTFEKLMPQTLEALERYLASGTIKGIGPATAKKIINTFGEETISVFKLEPNKLATIKGITPKKAIEMGESFNENWDLWQIVGFLERFRIGANNAKRIYQLLGKDAVNQIEENPYLLVDMVRGVDFKQIDQMAIDLGIDYSNGKRVKSGIKYSLLLTSYNGHTCVLKENLIKFVKDLLKVDEECIEDAIIDLKVLGEIIIEDRKTEEWVYLEPFDKAENNIAARLTLLQSSKNIKKISKFKKQLEKIQQQSEIELSNKQKEAIQLVNDNNVCIITGGPGTGKTTIIKSIIDLYKNEDKKVVLCAPTGRAAKRITETTRQEAKTLHRVLEIGKVQEDTLIEHVDYDIAPLDADVVIVDEVSMVDVFLMNHLVKALYQGTKLILVGDVDQLPSVGPGNILEDMILSEVIPTIHLDKIFRQAAKSKIIINAHRVNSGENFADKSELEKDSLEDFFYIKESNQEKMLYHILTLSKDRLKNYGNYEFFQNIQVITPTKKGMLGTRELNKALQNKLNPKEDGKKEKNSMGMLYREGDRIMQIKNNYDLFWEKEEPTYEAGSGIFNGEMGRIEQILEEEKSIKVRFDDNKYVYYPFEELDQIEHAYAITVHKSQGSEFDVVLMPIAPSSPKLLTRNLLYTGITRAKKMLVIIGSEHIIQAMIKNADNKKRNTGLEYKLKNL